MTEKQPTMMERPKHSERLYGYYMGYHMGSNITSPLHPGVLPGLNVHINSPFQDGL